MIIKNENDIYIYFETIEQLEPQSVLDAGMFLKRIGSVSRKVMDREISEKIRLDGIDFFPEKTFAVWDHVYDSVSDTRSFLENKRPKQYDLAVFLGIKAMRKKPGFAEISKIPAKRARYLLADQNLEQWNGVLPEEKIKELNLEGKRYFLYDFGV